MSGWVELDDGGASIRAGTFSGHVFAKSYSDGWFAGWGTPGVTHASLTHETPEEAKAWVEDQIRQAALDVLCSLPPVERDPEGYIAGLGTVRICRCCGCAVAGGPTSCVECGWHPEGVPLPDELHEPSDVRLVRALLSVVEAWRARGGPKG